jgi:hypothetical protein
MTIVQTSTCSVPNSESKVYERIIRTKGFLPLVSGGVAKSGADGQVVVGCAKSSSLRFARGRSHFAATAPPVLRMSGWFTLLMMAAV